RWSLLRLAVRVLPRGRVRYRDRRSPRPAVAPHHDPALVLSARGARDRRDAARPRPPGVALRRAGLDRALRSVLAARDPWTGLPAATHGHRQWHHPGACCLGRWSGITGH